MHLPAPKGFTAIESVVMLGLLIVWSMVSIAVLKKGVTHSEFDPTGSAGLQAAPVGRQMEDIDPAKNGGTPNESDDVIDGSAQ